jgi:gliding-associated putative ABC transporter substrate-binding component GldG
MKNIQILKYSLLLFTGIIILLNVLSDRFYLRLDTTEDNRYTLSPATKDILRNLQEPVTIKAYFSEELPPQLMQARKQFNDLLVEYARRSDGMVMYEFIDPTGEEATEMEAQQAGIPPLQVQVRNNDKFEAMVVYLGAVIQMGESQPEVIPQILENMPLEYYLTSAIKKVSVMDKPGIAFLQGHGEPGPQAYTQALQQLDVLYQTDFITLNDTIDALAPYNTLAIIAPTDSIPESHLRQIENFLARGNNVFIAINRVQAELQQGFGSSLGTGLEAWLSAKGINVENSFLTDANCGRIGVMQNMGGFRVQQQIPFPYIPIIKNFNPEHPVSKGIEEAIFSFMSPINIMVDTTIKVTTLAYSSENSGTASAPVYFNVQRNWTEADFPQGNLPVAAALEGQIAGNLSSRMVVFGDGDFAVNTSGQQGQQINPDNISLLTNSIDWLTDETGLIDLRTKEVTSRPIKDMEDGRKTFLKWLNFLLPIIVIILAGLIRWQRQNLKRIRRMQPDYVK